MAISYSARQFEITASIRRQAEQGLEKIGGILGIHNPEEMQLSVFLSADRRSVKAELRADISGHKLAAEASAGDGTSALAEALEKLTNQVHKLRSRMVGEKRRARRAQEKIERSARTEVEVEAEQNPERVVGVSGGGMQTIPVVVHDFPARVKVTETHIVRAENAVAKKRMSLEEAVKEMEFRDKDVFVFRDAAGKVKVLYRTREGRLELIEVP